MLPSRSSSIPGLMSDREGDRDDIKGWQEEEGVIADGLYHYQHRQEEERRNSLKRLSRYKEIEKHMLENPVGGKCEEEEYEDTELIHARKPKRRRSILKEGSHYPDSTRMAGMYFENQSETSSAQNESLSQQQKQRDDSYRRFPRELQSYLNDENNGSVQIENDGGVASNNTSSSSEQEHDSFTRQRLLRYQAIEKHLLTDNADNGKFSSTVDEDETIQIAYENIAFTTKAEENLYSESSIGQQRLRVFAGTNYSCLMLKGQSLSILFQQYATVQGLDENDLEFYYFNTKLTDQDTPGSIQLQQGDTICVRMRRANTNTA